MAAIMTKRGNLDNIITYEFMCDNAEDLQNIDPQYITLGSVAIIVNEFEVYMANSKKEWVSLGEIETSGNSNQNEGNQEEESSPQYITGIVKNFYIQSNLIPKNTLIVDNDKITGTITYMEEPIIYIGYYTVPTLTPISIHIPITTQEDIYCLVVEKILPAEYQEEMHVASILTFYGIEWASDQCVILENEIQSNTLDIASIRIIHILQNDVQTFSTLVNAAYLGTGEETMALDSFLRERVVKTYDLSEIQLVEPQATTNL